MLRERGVDVECLFIMHWGDTGPAVSALRAAGIRCSIATGVDRTEERIHWILDRLRENPPDVFVPNLVIAAYFAARWAREAGIATVGVLHSDDPFYHAILDTFAFGPEKYRVSSLVCVSEELERAVHARGSAAFTVERIPYGVGLPERRVQRSRERLRLAYVGRLAEEQKRISDVTRSMCMAVRSIEGVEAVIYGDGPDKAAVGRIVESEGAGLPIALGGRVDAEEMQTRMLDVDVIVLLSDYEGLPIALLEAMACGCVPVCLAIRSGIPELVENEVSGLLVRDRGDAFVGAVRRLRDDAVLWTRLSDGARASASRFSDEASADSWATFLTNLGRASAKPRIVLRPRRLDLPAVHPMLASADARVVRPNRWAQRFGQARMFLGRVRRQVFRR